MTARPLPLAGNRSVLQQGAALLERLTDAQYPDVGSHFRHALDHYLALFRGLPTGRIDYDARDRDERLEHSRVTALQVTRQCLEALEVLDAEDRAVQVHMETEPGTGGPDWRASSIGRELQFLCSHTVHHYALIRLLLGPAQDLDPAFGVAQSTLVHQTEASER